MSKIATLKNCHNCGVTIKPRSLTCEKCRQKGHTDFNCIPCGQKLEEDMRNLLEESGLKKVA